MATFKPLSYERLIEFQKKIISALDPTIARQVLGKQMTPKRAAHMEKLKALNKARGHKLRRYRRLPVYLKGRLKSGKWLISNNKKFREIFDTPQEAQARVFYLNQFLRPGHPLRSPKQDPK